ncbi:hypothetical protein QAD02_001459 [Eretmocerus hayati]|uniref:Uncharacterized protein n=1 Tax=Eretmocerus hayati TaxID=131215 RepID=A0ACC2NKW3_9HYME|nr:hypothetical protein QAD02_001459 [Eretmocerus hayati]
MKQYKLREKYPNKPTTVAVSDYVLVSCANTNNRKDRRVRGVFMRENSFYYPHATLGYTEKATNDSKFLQYLPLVVGMQYYYELQWEKLVYELVSINLADESKISHSDTVTLRKIDTNEIIVVPRSLNCSGVMHEEHKAFLLSGYEDKTYSFEADGNVVNFPISPKITYTAYKVQGETIDGPINMILNHADYDTLYVIMSRVKSKRSIECLDFPQKELFLLSVVTNFDELETCKSVNLDSILKKLFSVAFRNEEFVVHRACRSKPLREITFNKLIEFASEPIGSKRSQLFAELRFLVKKYFHSSPLRIEPWLLSRMSELTKDDKYRSFEISKRDGKDQNCCTLDLISAMNRDLLRCMVLSHPAELHVWIRFALLYDIVSPTISVLSLEDKFLTINRKSAPSVITAPNCVSKNLYSVQWGTKDYDSLREYVSYAKDIEYDPVLPDTTKTYVGREEFDLSHCIAFDRNLAFRIADETDKRADYTNAEKMDLLKELLLVKTIGFSHSVERDKSKSHEKLTTKRSGLSNLIGCTKKPKRV